MKNSMKNILCTSALVVLGSAALAQSSSLEDTIIAQLEAQGYTVTEVETENGELHIEAEMDGVETEFTYDSTTGELLGSEVETEDDDDEDDDDEDDADEDDADEDEDADEDDDEDEDDA